MYVNTTNSNLDLSRGAVAKALAKAAGPSLQAECKKKQPVRTGDYAVTGAGILTNCRHILHVVAPFYGSPGAQRVKIHGCYTYTCLPICDCL